MTTKFTGSCCEMVKVAANNADQELQYWLDRLTLDQDSGWSPETMPMRDLKVAADTLRSLAGTIEDLRLKFTAGNEHE